MIIKFVEFKELVDAYGSNGTESIILFKLGNTVFEAVFLDFLPEFNTGVVGGNGRSLNGGVFFLWLSEDENKNSARD